MSETDTPTRPTIPTGSVEWLLPPAPEPIRPVYIPGIQQGSIELGPNRGSEVLALDPATIRRVELPDLMKMESWIVPKIIGHYPEATRPQIMGFLLNCLSSNTHWFVHTSLAVGLAQLSYVPLEQQPIVQEIFVLAQEYGNDDVRNMYRAMASWAAHQNASRMIVGAHSDTTHAVISYCLGLKLSSLPGKSAYLGRVF